MSIVGKPCPTPASVGVGIHEDYPLSPRSGGRQAEGREVCWRPYNAVMTIEVEGLWLEEQRTNAVRELSCNT